MLLQVDLRIQVDRLTADRLRSASPQHLWKQVDLLVNTRPEAVTFLMKVLTEEGAPDATPAGDNVS
jgi:hypothetical protein